MPTPEPYAKRTSHGMILGEDNQKMSKSRGNVINPDDIVNEYGADTMRLYEMFVGDFEKAAPWSSAGVKGCRRFVERYWNLQNCLSQEKGLRPELEAVFHKTIKKVGEDTETLKFNTAIAALMTLLNAISEKGDITREELKLFTLLLNPFAPHVTEEMWQLCGLGEDGAALVAQQPWPKYDEAKCKEDTVEIVVQVCGKVRSRLTVSADSGKEELLAAAKADGKIAAEIAGKTIVKEICVPGKLVNLVVK